MAIATTPSTVRLAQRPDAGLRHNLLAIRADGALFNAMVGMGENYFAAFALAIGLGQAVSGLVTTIPLFLGAILQLASPWGVRRLGSHRRWVVLCATCQSLSFLPLCVAAIVGKLPAPVLFLIIALYWGSGMATIPAWNTWVGRLVPLRLRAQYFALRTRTSQGALLCGFLTAGITLQIAADFDQAQFAFAGLFLVAAACRLTSAGCLASQSEPTSAISQHLSFREIVARFRHSSEGRLLLYLIALQASVQISGPYFTPFMLKQMKLSYGTYATLIGVSFAAKIIAAPWWGTIAQRYGARVLMWFGGVGIIPIASLWLVSQSLPYLIVVQMLSGIMWAAYELAMFLLLFDSIAEEERVSILTAYNFANATAMGIGSLAGAGMLALAQQSYTAYLTVFAVSSMCRAASLPLLWRVQTVPIMAASSPIRPTVGSSALNSAARITRIDDAHVRPAPHLPAFRSTEESISAPVSLP